MAVKHTIKTKAGTEAVNLTPRGAIRRKCMDCTGWNRAEVRECPVQTCPLWPFRNPGPPKGDGDPVRKTDRKKGGKHETQTEKRP